MIPFKEPPSVLGNLALWQKAWETWEAIGKEMVLRRSPTVQDLHSLVHPQPKIEHLEALSHSVPSQTLLVSFLEALVQVRRGFWSSAIALELMWVEAQRITGWLALLKISL